MRNKILLIMCMILFINFVSAAQITNVNTNTGYQIFYPQFETVPQDMNFNLHVHLSNISNGHWINNSLADCRLHLYNTTGDHTFESGLLKKDSNWYDWEVYITQGNFSDIGTHAFYIFCYSADFGGEARGTFEVTPTGASFDTSNAVLYGFILALIGMFLFFSINGIKKSTSGSWLIAYICLTYILLYLLIGFLYLMSKYYLFTTPIFESIFYIAWFVMGVGFLPFVIVLTLYILGQEAKAVLKRDYMGQGYNEEEARELSKRKNR